jgi:hypothetical protein
MKTADYKFHVPERLIPLSPPGAPVSLASEAYAFAKDHRRSAGASFGKMSLVFDQA